ncbi:MAG: DNA primase DnaG [Nanoarchaeota archaeon]|nr:DNA primase DnaG [Nanoarchaeota archaeon]
MAKISPTSIKYSIIANFTAEGPFQKPDVIGALFGQTEGLLGSDMELRELQKEGKIGRIEVNLQTVDGKTTGEILIPSALDKTETTIIAAALETIDKIGPTDARISVKEIEDVRGSKRDYIMERAKQLLAGIKNEGKDSTEMGNEIREGSRIAKVIDYGEEGLAAGPDVDSANEVVVVEGRADVVNLVRYGIKNVIGMQGTKFPRTITQLGEKKELTLFVDGDRGGKLIAKNVFDNAKIVYIAQAPDGKEVEELAGKEILLALRRKVPAKDFFRRFDDFPRKVSSGPSITNTNVAERRKVTDSDIEKLRELSIEVKGKNVLVVNEKMEIVQNIPSSRLGGIDAKEGFVLVVAIATESIIEAAEKLGSRAVAAKTFGKLPQTNIELISL